MEKKLPKFVKCIEEDNYFFGVLNQIYEVTGENGIGDWRIEGSTTSSVAKRRFEIMKELPEKWFIEINDDNCKILKSYWKTLLNVDSKINFKNFLLSDDISGDHTYMW